MNKKGVSDVISEVLLVLIVLAAIAILWLAISAFITANSEKIGMVSFANLDIVDNSATFNQETNQIKFRLKRDSVEANISGYRAIVEDVSGDSKSSDRDFYIGMLESKFDSIELPVEIMTPAKIYIAPIFIIDGKKKVGSVTDEETIKAVVKCSANPQCNDGLYCNGVEVCNEGLCEAGEPVETDDGVSCTIDSCNEATDSITHVADNSICNDELYCNGIETCSSSLDCQSGIAPICDDGVSCTIDSCNEATDSCMQNTASCACTPATQTIDCNDGNSCTDDTCINFVCVNTNDNSNSCNDKQYCTTNDQCNAGVCSGSQINIDDGVSCTIDSCNGLTNSTEHIPSNALCDNDLYCDGQEVCSLTLDCQSGIAPICDDGVSCTIDSCNELADSCSITLDDSQCNLGEICDPIDNCIQGLLFDGPKIPGTIISAPTGSVPWTNPLYAQTLNTLSAVSDIGEGQTTYFLEATDFGFDIPPEAVVTGVKAEVWRYTGSGSGNRGQIIDSQIILIVGGTKQGQNKKNSNDWSSSDYLTTNWQAYGNATDTWDMSLTPSQINANNFGMAIKAENVDEPGANTQAKVNAINMTVYYSLV